MPITQSAKKALRQSVRRRQANGSRKNAYKQALKNYTKAVHTGDAAQKSQKLSALYVALDKAAKTGVIKKNTASRMKSRAAHRIAKSTKASS